MKRKIRILVLSLLVLAMAFSFASAAEGSTFKAYNRILDGNGYHDVFLGDFQHGKDIKFVAPDKVLAGHELGGWELLMMNTDEIPFEYFEKANGTCEWMDPWEPEAWELSRHVITGDTLDADVIRDDTYELFILTHWVPEGSVVPGGEADDSDESKVLDTVDITDIKLTASNKVKLTWNTVEGAAMYDVYQKVAGNEYALCYIGKAKDSDKQSTIITKLPAGKKVSFKVIATDENGIFYNEEAEVVSIRTLAKPTKVKVTATKGKANVKFSVTSGADGYQISKSTKKTGTNIVKTVKTTKSGSKSALLKATMGKTYYYKVRTFSIEDGKKVYGPWSTVVKYKR